LRQVDLASIVTIDRFAASVLDDYERLDVVINNAGVMAFPERRTSDGFEMQLGTNHLGHYVLTARLLPLLVATEGSRVVSVTSGARHFGRPIDPTNPNLEGTYDKWRAYGQSKLANVHFALGLEDRLRAAGSPTISLVAHPGLATTNLQVTTAREGGGESSERMVRRIGMSPANGALPQLRAATDPGAKGGEFYAPRWVNWGPPVRRPLMGRSRDNKSIETLFQISEDLTGVPLDVPRNSHI
jgi:NAD(P)-dependent dehydrogenase (short-subunit alcohol dehydrogenase family)